MRLGRGIDAGLPWETRKVVLLDGRLLTASTIEDLRIRDRDGNIQRVCLDYLAAEGAIGKSIFKLITDRLSTHSLSYASQVSHVMRRWMRSRHPVGPAISLANLEQILSPTPILPESYRPFIMPLLHIWAQLGLPGLSDELESFLVDFDSWEEKGNGAYFTLLTNDPMRGAFTPQELRNLHDALDQAYINGSIDLDDYALAWFFIATGVRPVQAHRMTLADVQRYPGPEGIEVVLLVPLAKGEKTCTQEKWRRRAPTVLANCLLKYLEQPHVAARAANQSLFSFNSSRYLSLRLQKIFSKLDTWSARLQGPIPVFPYRFRYTLGTRAVADGATDHEVARLLTHRTTHCVRYYRASMPELQKPIRDRLGASVGVFAKAFQGRLIESLAEATRANEGDALILDFLRLAGKRVGACSTRTECHLHAPIACLSCPFFEPFRGAPWEELEEQIRADGETETNPRIREIHSHALEAIREIKAQRDGSAIGGGA